MKKFIYIILALSLALSLFACGEKPAAEEPAGEPVYYEGHGVRLEIPEVWKDDFVSYYKEFGENESAYTVIELMAVIGGDEAGIMAIASFKEDAWQNVLKSTPEAKKMEIGTSKDGKTHYTVRYDDKTKFENREHQEKFDAIISAAKSKKDTIEILN